MAQAKTWLSAAVAASLVGQAAREQPLAEKDSLSERELEVLRLMAQGCSNGKIAEALSIPEVAVKNHVTNIYNHLGVHARAWQHGLVQAS